MKANEAPEKIYIDTHDNPNNVWMCAFRPPFQKNDSVEYVRTDAFIEKALAFIRSCTTYDGLGYKAKCVNIEDFKNYMKGE